MVAGLIGLGTATGLVGAVALVAFAMSLRSSMPDTFEIMAATRAQPTLVYAASGEKLTQFEPRFREWVPLDSIPLHFTHALISTEDRRFYEHGGVDIRRTVGALYYTARGDRQGGSTVTQQLTRNLFPEEIGGVGVVERKVKEVVAARAIEGAHTKRDILEAYVNTAPFLYNAHGVERAAKTYFGVPARELTVAQSATLVAMLKGTDRYNPVRNPERSLERRNLVLRLMGEMGHLSPNEVTEAQEQPLGVTLRPQPGEESLAPHFTEMVRLRLTEWAQQHGYDLERDGLIVRTTLDLAMQREAEAVVAERIPQVARASGARYSRETLDVHLRRTDAYQVAVARGQSEADALREIRSDRALVDSVKAV
ncbi:MAG: transglycosylase domain-containing protein, partial [Bacteroidota bacterium]